jgi:hypothetical protein
VTGWQRKTPREPREPRSGAFAVRMINAERSLPPEFETATKRCARMSNTDLYSWAESALSGIGRCLNDDQHENPPTGDAMREAERAAVTLYAALSTMASRRPVPDASGAPNVDTLRRMGSTLKG